MSNLSFPEPSHDVSDPATLLDRYLRYYRATMMARLRALPEADRRASRLPSGWSPLELVNHLGYMERRWLVWGFLGEQVRDPWGDATGERWQVAADTTVDLLQELLDTVAARTTAVLRAHRLDEPAAVGGRFAAEDGPPPTLAWICFHVLQEYARHAGHLDIAVELAGGPTGE